MQFVGDVAAKEGGLIRLHRRGLIEDEVLPDLERNLRGVGRVVPARRTWSGQAKRELGSCGVLFNGMEER